MWRGSPLRPQTSCRPQPLLLPGSGRAVAAPCRRRRGDREARPCPRERGAAWERGRGGESFFLPEMDFLPPERSGLACRRLPPSVQLLHTLFCLRSGPKYFTCCHRLPRRPGALHCRAAAPGLHPPRRSRPGKFPLCLYFHRSWVFLNLCLRGKMVVCWLSGRMRWGRWGGCPIPLRANITYC